MAVPRNRLVFLLRVLAIALGATNAGAAAVQQAMGHEGINYLDQGDAWFRGDWSTAVNGTWSPLYAILLGLTLRVTRPSMGLEFPVVHAVNFMVYVAALFAFEFLWKEVSARYYARQDDVDLLPPWAFTSIGYALFMWTSVCLIRVFVVTPDMLVALAIFLSSGLLLRLTSERAPPWTAAWFGASLGAAFLATSVLLPVIIVMLLLAATILIRAGRRRHAIAAAVGFVMVSAPFVIAFSRDAGRFTLGGIGRVNYLKYVLLAPFPHYRHGSPDIGGTPVHPMDITTTTPPVIRFDVDMPVTYPPVYDQGYWYAGLTATFRPALQFRAIAVNLQRYFELFVRWQGFGLAIVAAWLIVRGRRAIDTESWLPGAIAVAALGLYALVHVEARFVAPFVVLLWAAALGSVRLPAAPKQPAWLRASSIVMLAGLAINIGVFHLDGLNAMVDVVPVAVAGPVSANDTGPDKPTDVALALRERGLAAGDRVGVIGDAMHASWARLARLRIVAEVAPTDVASFWRASAEDRAAVLLAFEAARVRAVIAQAPPSDAPLEGWSRLGSTSLYLRQTPVGAGSTSFPAVGR